MGATRQEQAARVHEINRAMRELVRGAARAVGAGARSGVTTRFRNSRAGFIIECESDVINSRLTITPEEVERWLGNCTTE